MKHFFAALALFLVSLPAFAQTNSAWVHDFVAPGNHIYSYIDSKTDAAGNSYLLWIDHDFGHQEFLAKMSPGGALLWIDTLTIPNRIFSASWTLGNLSLVGDRVVVGGITYPPSGYGEATIVVLDTMGNMLNHKEITVWYQIGAWQVMQNANHDLWFVYSQGTPFDQAPIMYASRLDANLNVQWVHSYPQLKLCTDVATLLDDQDNLYLSYSQDSIAGGGQHIRATTRKLDPAGNELWMRPHVGANYKKAVVSGSSLVLAGKEYNTTNYMSNDTGNALITFIDLNTGQELLNDNYNSASPYREITADLLVDGAGDVWWLGVENVSTVGPTGSSTVVRKYAPSGNLIWSRSTPTYPIGGGPGNFVHDASGRIWACNFVQNGLNVMLWRLSTTGQIDSTLQHSLNPLYYGVIRITADTLGNLYLGFQQVQCGGNRVGIVKFGTLVDPPVSVAQAHSAPAMHLAPNPARSRTVIHMSATASGPASISVVDISGKLVLQENALLNGGEVAHSLDVAGLESGIYFVSITQNGTRIATGKLLKE